METAKVITAAVRAAGRKCGLKPLTVIVLDAGGHLMIAASPAATCRGHWRPVD